MADDASSSSKKRKADKEAEFWDPRTIKRLTKEFARIPKDSKTSATQYSVHLEDDDIGRWVVRYYYDDLPEGVNKHAKLLSSQLKERDLSYVEMMFIFSPDYPGKPPFVYNSFPRLWGSFLSPCGALCHEMLHPSHGWTGSMNLSTFIIALRSILEEDVQARLFTRDVGGESSGSELLRNDEETARRTNDFYLAAHRSGY